MKTFNIFFGLLQLLLLVSCNPKHERRKTFNVHNHVINVKEQIVHMEFEDPLLSSFAAPYILDKYLIITDNKSYDNMLHIFDKNTFQHIKSLGAMGNGPKEIANLVGLVMDKNKSRFYVIDYGKEGLMSYSIDSVLNSPDYIPHKKSIISKQQVPIELELINDTIAYALFTKFQDNSDYKPVVAKFNMATGKISYMKHEGHPEIKRKRVNMAVSTKNNMFVEAYWHHDLLCFSSLDGNTINYVYGNNWDTKMQNSELYFENIMFCKDKLFASYWGDKRFVRKNGYETTNNPDKLLVFDLDGNHMHTLNVSRPILDFCYDEENNRLIFVFDDEIQFGYLDISKWL